MSNDLTKTKPRLFYKLNIYSRVTWLLLTNMQTSVNANFLSKWDFFYIYQGNSMSNDLTKIEPRLFSIVWMRLLLWFSNTVTSEVGWLDITAKSFRPHWTLTFWLNETFLVSFQHNSMSNYLTKIEPRLFYNVKHIQ